MMWCVASAVVAVLSVPSIAEPTLAETRTLTETEAKAGFLYNCAMFVVWPPSVVHTEDLVIAVVGDDPVAKVMEGMEGRSVNGKTLHVHRLQPGDGLDEVQIVFVGDDAAKAASGLLAGVDGAPILTVGDRSDFLHEGGVVRLYMEQDRLRFEINMTRIERAGLRVSAKMLSLARIVR